MSVSKRRKTGNASLREAKHWESYDRKSAVITEEEKTEKVFFPEFGWASEHVVKSEFLNRTCFTENIKVIGGNVAPTAGYLPAFRSFVCPSIPNSCVRIRLNLPNLVVPEKLLAPDENAMRNLSILLLDMGFEVVDRATLVFFAIGSEHDFRKAAQRFLKFREVVNRSEFKSPSREVVELMDIDGIIEGFARHRDGTFGVLCHGKKYNPGNHPAIYIFREILCYILSMIDLSLLRKGFISVFNARNMTWKAFAPFEIAKLFHMHNECLPLKMRRRYLIDPGKYYRLARQVCKPLIPREFSNTIFCLTSDEARHNHPHLVLPESITGLTQSKFIKYLSVHEQLDFKFFLENPQ